MNEDLIKNIKTFIERMNDCLNKNKEIHDNLIIPEIEIVNKILSKNNFPIEEFKNYFAPFKKLIEQIPSIQEFNNDILNNLNNKTLSTQYLTLINSELQSLNSYFSTYDAIDNLKSNLPKFKDLSLDYNLENAIYSYLLNILNQNSSLSTTYIEKIFHLRAFELIKDTEQNENVVIIGSNGSGKSSFSRSINTVLGENIAIIPAQKVFQYIKLDSIPITNKINEFWNYQKQAKLCKDSNFISLLADDMNKLVGVLVADYVQLGSKYLQERADLSKEGIEIPILERVIKIWNEIIVHRELYYDTQGNIKVKGQDISNYEFELLSDGEKAVFYYTAHILLAKENSFIIVDEPENHLNLSVVTKLWNTLEKQRQDCIFMYLTHNLHFASSRINARKLWMKSFDQKKLTWEIKYLPNNNEIPESLYMELLGSKRKILFCEGNDNSSYDYKVYSILFPDYTIKPVKGHIDVINSVRAFNKSKQIHGNEAIGIIDRDFHTEEERRSWEKDNIYSLKVYEIENLFLDEKLIEEAIKQFYSEETLEQIKNELFEFVNKDIERQAFITARDKVNAKLISSLSSEKNSIDNLKNELSMLLQKMNVDSLYNEQKNKLKNLVKERKWDGILEENNNKGLVAELNKILVSNYVERIILLLRDNKDLQRYIKNKYLESLKEIL